MEGLSKKNENIIINSFSSKSIKSSMKQIDERGIINEKAQIKLIMKYCKKLTGFSSWRSGKLENEIKNRDWLPQENKKI